MITINATKIIKDNFSEIRAKYIFITDYDLAGQSRKMQKEKGQTYKCDFSNRDEAVKYIVKRCKMYNEEMDKHNYWYSDERLAKETREIISQKRLDTIRDKNHDVIEKQTGIWASTLLLESIRRGDHVSCSRYSYGKRNQVICTEEKDWEGYSRSFGFPMIYRSFEVCVKKGYTIHLIGGIITYIKGNRINRLGMPCEWVKQGRAIADLLTVKGYLVRGQHIEASSLDEAKQISEENRRKALPAMLAARIEMKARRERQKEEEQKWEEEKQKRAKEERMMAAMVTREITFEDSLNSGNCFPGTDSFKKRLEEEIGHPVESINALDLLSYATKYGLKSYALRTIKYVLGNK